MSQVQSLKLRTIPVAVIALLLLLPSCPVTGSSSPSTTPTPGDETTTSDTTTTTTTAAAVHPSSPVERCWAHVTALPRTSFQLDPQCPPSLIKVIYKHLNDDQQAKIQRVANGHCIRHYKGCSAGAVLDMIRAHPAVSSIDQLYRKALQQSNEPQLTTAGETVELASTNKEMEPIIKISTSGDVMMANDEIRKQQRGSSPSPSNTLNDRDCLEIRRRVNDLRRRTKLQQELFSSGQNMMLPVYEFAVYWIDFVGKTAEEHVFEGLVIFFVLIAFMLLILLVFKGNVANFVDPFVANYRNVASTKAEDAFELEQANSRADLLQATLRTFTAELSPLSAALLAPRRLRLLGNVMYLLVFVIVSFQLANNVRGLFLGLPGLLLDLIGISPTITGVILLALLLFKFSLVLRYFVSSLTDWIEGDEMFLTKRIRSVVHDVAREAETLPLSVPSRQVQLEDVKENTSPTPKRKTKNENENDGEDDLGDGSNDPAAAAPAAVKSPLMKDRSTPSTNETKNKKTNDKQHDRASTGSKSKEQSHNIDSDKRGGTKPNSKQKREEKGTGEAPLDGWEEVNAENDDEQCSSSEHVD